MLYTMIYHDDYRTMVFDSDQVRELLGDKNSRGKLEERIDINNSPNPLKHLFAKPLNVSFPVFNKGDKAKKIPDIGYVQGRLFLTPKAYDVLKPLIEHDGEFIPLTYENGDAYFFNPLRTAEDVDGLDETLSIKNEWLDVENLAFHEDKIKDWSIFRTAFDNYMTLQIQKPVKEAIEAAGLTGVYITSDLGRIFPEPRTDHIKAN